MADLDDLGYISILNMDNDEALDTLRQIRLSRRIPDKPKVIRETKKQTTAKVTTAVNAEMAAELLKLLGGS
uniref:Uncharacterized protein n=1 Tax=viral metagenome TaxID=1070528 RepID=A0A6M3JPY4_9ZZZZ